MLITYVWGTRISFLNDNFEESSSQVYDLSLLEFSDFT